MSELLAASVGFMDGHWDDGAALIRHPSAPTGHAVRESAWYALGLWADGERDRARRAIDAVLAQQFDAPGTIFHGTFRRLAEEPDPPDEPVEWVHYDPNWRQFIGCTLAVMLADGLDHPGAERAIDLAVQGEPPDRVSPRYSNIAMLRAWLEAWLGARRGRDELVERGEAMARAVADRYDQAGGLDEFNSPTYYGIDLWALALWRNRPPSPVFADLGARLEASVWRDTASFFHQGLRNLCGPWTRSYGMDMTRYLATVGLQLWASLDTSEALPDLDGPFEHAHDLCFGAAVAVDPGVVPDDARDDLRTFTGPRAVDRVVAGRRITAHLAHDAMSGAYGGKAWAFDQFHPATMHWRSPDAIRWLRVRPDGLLDATAVPGGLHLEAGDDGIRVDLSPEAHVDLTFSSAPVRADELRFGAGTLRVELTR